MVRHNVWTGQRPRPIWIIAWLLVLSCRALGLTLKETAEVYLDQIYLKDIILEAEEDSPWGEISVLQSPAIGSKRAVYKSFVVTVFRKNGYLIEAENLTGPNKIDVTRPIKIDESFAENKIATEPKSQIEPALEIGYDSLWTEVKGQITSLVKDYVPKNFSFQIILESYPQGDLPMDIVSIAVDSSVFRNVYYGRIIVPVDLKLEDGQQKRVLFTINISFEGEVFVATKDFRAKEPISKTSVTKQLRNLSGNPNNFFVPKYELEKYQARGYVRNGDILLSSQVEIRPLKNRGQTTKLYYQSGPIMIEVTVELLEDAVFEKTVRAKNLLSGKELLGVVQEDGTLKGQF